MPVDLIIRISLVRGETTASSEDGTRLQARMHGQGPGAFCQISGDDYNSESSGGSLTELSPPVWRRFRVSSAVNLELLHDKVLCPVMGWTRNYHTFAFCGTGPAAERTYYVQERTDATDLMWQGRRTDGRPTLDARDHTIGELLASVGDGCIYNYDLGDCFYHLLRLEEVVPELASTGRVEILGGEMRCPDEDGDGCAAYQEKVLDLHSRVASDPTDSKSARKLAAACFERRGTLNVLGRFDPAEFDLEARRAALADALNSRNSTYNSVKMFSSRPGFTMARIGQKGVTVKVYDPKYESNGGYVVFTETVNVKPDPQDATLCANCGSPNDLKQCGGCGSVYYCSRECQAAHWKLVHKKVCKKEKKAFENYQRELESGKPDPDRFVEGPPLVVRYYDPANLRFRVGTKVECMIGQDTYGTGRVVRQLYFEEGMTQQAPYQIKLDKDTARRMGVPHQHALIYAQWDDDFQIRKIS